MNTKIQILTVFCGSLLTLICQGQPALAHKETIDRARSPIPGLSRVPKNPLEARLQVSVENLYAATNANLEIFLNGHKYRFRGAGVDSTGNFIATNHTPVVVDVTLRREYKISITCSNTGPGGNALLKYGDFWDPDAFINVLTNYSAPSLLSEHIWTNFSSQARQVLTNSDSWEIKQTNLVEQVNALLLGPCLYTSQRFQGVTLSTETQDLLNLSPTGWDLIRLNRLLLTDAYYYTYYNFPPYYNYGDSSGTANIKLRMLSPHEYDLKKEAVPPQYTLLTNRVVFEDWHSILLGKPEEGWVSTNSFALEVLGERFAHTALEDGANNPAPSAGEGSWLVLGPGRTKDTNAISLDWGVSLGRTFDGLSAGRLRIHENGLTRDVFQPFAIYHAASSTNIRSQVDLVTTNAEGVLRQVRACQAFVDILAPDTNQTVLNFYFPSQVLTNKNQAGIYTNISGDPYVTWTIRNPEPSSLDRLLIIESRNGVLSTNSLVRTPTSSGASWALRYGSGATERLETRDVHIVESPSWSRYETNTIRYSAGPVASKTVETYRDFPWGTELTEMRVLSTPNQVTTLAYYDDTNAVYGYFGYGQIKHIIYPHGHWEKRIYEDFGYTYLWFLGEFDPDYYPYGLLRYLLEPNDEMPGAAMTPEEANIENSFVTVFAYPYFFWSSATLNGRITGRFDTTGTAGLPACITYLGNTTDKCSGPEGESRYMYTTKGQDDNYGWETTTYEYTDCPPGLSGHPWMLDSANGSNPSLFYYYDHGVFNPTANTFVIDTNNHLYTVSTWTNGYPDHRETTVVLESGLYSWAGLFIWEYEPWQDWFEEEDLFELLEGHQFASHNYSYSGLYKGSSTKETKIFQGGNLVQTEKYVYTGKSGDQADWKLLSKTRYYNDSLGHATNVVLIDGISGATQVVGTGNYRDLNGKDGILLRSSTDQFGAATAYTYDSLRRVSSAVSTGYGSQPDTTKVVTYDSVGRILTNSTSSSGLTLKEARVFDVAGRQTLHVDSSGVAVSTSYSADGMSETNTLPGGTKSVVQRYRSREVKSITGEAGVSEFHVHNSYDKGWYRNTTVHYGSYGSSRWVATGLDRFDLPYYEEHPISESTTNTLISEKHFEIWGYLSHQKFNQPLPSTYYTYDPLGNLRETRLGGEDGRITGSDQVMIQLTANGPWYHATTNYTYLEDESEVRTVTGVRLQQLNGFSGSEISRVIEYDVDGNQTTTTTYLERSQNKLTTVSSCPSTSLLSATNIYQNGMLQQQSTFSVAAPVRYYYDALGRTNQIKDSLGFSTRLAYYPSTGWLESMTDPAGNTTRYEYYSPNEANAGKVKCITSPTGKKTYFSYTSRGELYRTWGDVPYPSEYRYDQYGALTNLITFRAGSQWTGSTWPTATTGTGDNTYWRYDAASSALLQKIDAQGRATTYSYCTNTGRLLTRAWQRSVGGKLVTVTNSYNNFSDLVKMEYSDGTPMVVMSSFNRLGLPREIVDARGTNALTYDHAGRLVSSTSLSGPLAGVTVTNHFDGVHGRDQLKVLGLSTGITHDFGYDTYGRLATVGSGDYWAAYSYLPGSDLLQTTTCKSNTTPVLTTTRTWEYGMRLYGIA